MSDVYKFLSKNGTECEATLTEIEVANAIVEDSKGTNPINGPEHIEISPTGDIYVGSTQTGELWMLSRDESSSRDELCSKWKASLVTKLTRVLGIKCCSIRKLNDTDFIETLLICDTMEGLQEVEVRRVYNKENDRFSLESDVKVRSILTEVNGRTINFANAVTTFEAPDGHMYVLVSDSTKDSTYQFMVELLSPPSGRILAFDYTAFLESGKSNANEDAICILDKLSFVNGLHTLRLAETGYVYVLYVETLPGTLGVFKWNYKASKGVEIESKYTGPLFWDNVAPAHPRWPHGTDLLSSISLRCRNFIARYERAPDSLYLIAAPSQITTKVTALVTATKAVRTIFSWVPGFPTAYTPASISQMISSQSPAGAFVSYDSNTDQFETVYTASKTSSDILAAVSHACIADVIDNGVTLKALILFGSFEPSKQLRQCSIEIKKTL